MRKTDFVEVRAKCRKAPRGEPGGASYEDLVAKGGMLGIGLGPIPRHSLRSARCFAPSCDSPPDCHRANRGSVTGDDAAAERSAEATAGVVGALVKVPAAHQLQLALGLGLAQFLDA